jgi:hypothetical protein
VYPFYDFSQPFFSAVTQKRHHLWFQNKICYFLLLLYYPRKKNVQKWVCFGPKNEKSYGKAIFRLFKKMRALWSQSEIFKVFSHFLKGFCVLDILKMSIFVFRGQIWKKSFMLCYPPIPYILLYVYY